MRLYNNKMKIGVLYDGDINKQIDCCAPEQGNPGVGGTQYCFLMLLRFYPIMFPDDSIIVYVRNRNERTSFPNEDKIMYRSVTDLQECVGLAKADNVGILLFNFSHTLNIGRWLVKYNIKGIVWIHNWIRNEILKEIATNPMISKAVFLGNEHYDRYIDHDVIYKAVVIPNMFFVDDNFGERVIKHNVTYVGALVPGKGFDVLAREWHKVKEKVPDAKLYVIGTGKLYNEFARMGPYNLACEEYEKKFMSYLINEDGIIDDSVIFCGMMGKEKNKIYKETSVGIVNPSGKTEVCPISALEMSACGIPLVSKLINGIPDVIINNKSGILVHNRRHLARAIVKLLNNNEKNVEMGIEGKKFVQKSFNPELICSIWKETFADVYNNRRSEVRLPQKNYFINLKWIRVLIYLLKKISIFKRIPAFIDIEGKVLKAIER